MKIFILSLVILLTHTVKAQYRKNKKEYDPKTYSYQHGDRYNPTIAGVASFFIPGLGQIIADETGRGIAFFTANIATSALLIHSQYGHSESVSSQQIKTIISKCLLFATWGLSIRDAIRVAKVNNLAAREMNKKVSFSLQPIVLPQANTNHLAGGLQLNIRLD